MHIYIYIQNVTKVLSEFRKVNNRLIVKKNENH